jgi:MurNAc alpha-1-phosphate uridylyltransferase
MASSDLAALVLAAGEGKRLRPLTAIRPKPLCPINNRPLIDLALDEVTGLLGALGPGRLAVNVHHLAEQVVAHVGDRVHISIEQPRPLGTAGAVAQLRDWIAGRPLLVRNTDVWRGDAVPPAFIADWDGQRPRLLVVADRERPDFEGQWRYAGLSLLPWTDVVALPDKAQGLYEAVWAQAETDGRLELVVSDDGFIDCGTPRDYLRANLAASGGQSVIGPGSTVDGEVVRSVVWPRGVVRRDERLIESIRVGDNLTVDASLS